MKKAESLIKNTDMKISQIAIEVGYTNASYFSRSYKKFKGISPEDDRQLKNNVYLCQYSAKNVNIFRHRYTNISKN